MIADSFRLDAADGVSLACRKWLPAGPPVGLVQIAHGMAEHCGRYHRVAECLTDAGYAVYAHDHRGHGLTAATGQELGHYADHNGWASVLDDLRRVGLHARGEQAGVPSALLAHSMGSFLAPRVIASHRTDYDAYVLSGSTAPAALLSSIARWIARIERWRSGRRGKSRLLAFLSFGSFNRDFRPVRTEFDWLSRDPTEVDRYIADPLCGFSCTNQLWFDLLGGLAGLGRAMRSPSSFGPGPADIPIYLFAGDSDPVGARGKGVRMLALRYRAHGFRNVALRLYPNGRHEMLNETNRDEVMRDLVSWLDAAVLRGPLQPERAAVYR